MVASGLPIRNGTLHAREIACVALALKDAVNGIKGIGHRSEETVQLRVGIHTGKFIHSKLNYMVIALDSHLSW